MMSDYIPPGFMKNGQGHLVPVELIKDVDIIRDELVKGIMDNAKALIPDISKFKAGTMADIENFIEISADDHQTKWGGQKGNVSLTSYDGHYKVMLAIDDQVIFNEKLQVAKQIIDECTHEWTKDSSPEIKVLIEGAFQTDKAGNISTGRILALRQLDIKHKKWQEAMKAINESIVIMSSKFYLRLYERDDKDKYKQISFDLAAV